MQEISVETPIGTLTACVGGSPTCYPEIYVYLKRKDNVEIDLVTASVDIEANTAKAYLYGDTSVDTFTKVHIWSEGELYIDEG